MKLLSLIASLFIRGLRATIRIRHVRAENLTALPQYIVAFWHSHLLLMLHSKYRRPVTVIISQSKDGEYIARVFDWYGVDSARGSSTRGGGAALREMIRQSREGKNLAFTPDAPKGPARVAKDGVVWAARATGLPIVPIVFAAKKKSSSAPGTAWSSRTRSHVRSFSTVSRFSCRATQTWKNGAASSMSA